MEFQKYVYVANAILPFEKDTIKEYIRYKFEKDTFKKHIHYKTIGGMPIIDNEVTRKYKHHKAVYVINNGPLLDINAPATYVYVINHLPESDWPNEYEVVSIVNWKGSFKSFSTESPSHRVKQIYIVNLDDLKELFPQKRYFEDLKTKFPTKFPLKIGREPTKEQERYVRCTSCGVERKVWKDSRFESKCPVCGAVSPSFRLKGLID